MRVLLLADARERYESADFLGVNKPASIPVHPTGRFRHQSLLWIMASELGHDKLLPTHRLDRLTSGCVMFARNSEAAARLSELIRQDGVVHKEYLAMTHGVFPVVDNGAGSIEVNKPIGVFEESSGRCIVDEANGKPAVSTFQAIWSDPVRNVSVVRCLPRTGRTHQLRVHLQYLGFPIVGDPLYGAQLAEGHRVVDSDGRTLRDYEGEVNLNMRACANLTS